MTMARLLSSWRSRTRQSDPSWCLYLEQCSMERLIRRSPNNGSGDGFVCDWCEFVTVFVRVWVLERERSRESLSLPLPVKDTCRCWIQKLWIIDKWLCSCSNELAVYYKQQEQPTAVNYCSSFSQCQYPAFSSVCIYAYFIKAMFY